jgi:hypothetical protein
MNIFNRFRLRELLPIAASLIIISIATPSLPMQKSGGGTSGGSATGTIYYIDTGRETNYLWGMGADGSNKTEVGKWGYFAVPSRGIHNGYRWHITTLSIPGSFYPDGSQRFEVFATRGDFHPVLNSNSETLVQLTDDPTLQPTFPWFRGAAWFPGDLRISFRARRWVGTVPVEGGIYTADLTYREDGNIMGLAAQPTTPAIASPLDSTGWPTVGYHSWDPTGLRVVYTDSAAPGLWIANLTTNTRTRIVSTSASYPDWSPLGDKIVFSAGSTINTVKIDGTGNKAVIKPTYLNTAYWSSFGHPCFSPNGGYITCVGWTSDNGGTDDVFRATSSGGSLTNLTRTPTVNEVPIIWR